AKRQSGDLAHESYHDAEYFQRAFRSDDWIGLVLRPEDEAAPLEIEPLERKLIIDDRNDDFAAPCTRSLLDDDKIAVQHTGVDHGIAFDPHQHRLRRMLDKVIVEGKRVSGPVIDRAWKPCVHRGLSQRTLEKTPRRCQPPIR